MKKGSMPWLDKNSMQKSDDSYGTKHREELKKSMEKPFVSYNRRQKKDSIDVTTFVLGWVIVALMVGIVLAQIAIHYGWRP